MNRWIWIVRIIGIVIVLALVGMMFHMQNTLRRLQQEQEQSAPAP